MTCPNLFWEEFVPDVARRRRQTKATRLAPGCLIDFLFVADCQAPGCFRCHEDRVTHVPARTTVLGFNLLPKLNASKFEFRKFFFDLPAQTIFIAFSRALAPSGKHPKPVALSSYEQHPSALRSHQFRGFRHSLYRRNIQSAEDCSQLKADKSQSNPAHSNGQWYAGRDRNNKPDHLTVHVNRSGSTSLTVVGPPDEEFQGHANSCRSGSGPFGACALPDVFELWWPSVFTSVLTFTEVFDMGNAPQ